MTTTTTGTTDDTAGAGRLPRSLAALHPLTLLRSSEPWRATAYLAGYVLLGPVLFAFCFGTLVVSAALNITMLGLPLLIGAAALLRGCAHIERLRAGLVRDPVPADYRTVEPTGILAAVKARWSDPATLRDALYLVALFVPLLVLDAAGLALWLTGLALVVFPAWYWTVPDGSALGLLRVDDLPSAFLVSLAACALTLVTVCAVVAAARLHAAVAHKLLGPRTDPLAAAKRLLAEPGPLSGVHEDAGPSSPSSLSSHSRGMTA
ncbi:sensor domain-containing protein [Streptomyces sp. TRM64462]|uniref:sensor domain-containing protein n=1 Tax=Streptomyces sp. TRM64462 TaxID=2741726 RepID=UPI00158678B9|nr:sensor domain-containing protein [Streptomyces sp. TRM64462]